MKESSSELKTAIAAVFLGEGKPSLTEEEFIKASSMKRRWFSPDYARKFLENAISSGILLRKGKNLTPSFEYADEEIPFDYYPSNAVLEGAEKIDSERSPDADGPFSEYPFVDELKMILSDMLNGKDVSERLKELEKSLMQS